MTELSSEFNRLINNLKEHILDYLDEKGLIKLGLPYSHIKCFHPKHSQDLSPSLRWNNPEKFGWRIRCFGCGWSADIFDVYAVLEGTPSQGPGWFEKTLIPLAEKYGYPLPEREITEEEKYLRDLYQIYEQVAGLLDHRSESMGGTIQAYVENKQWTRETLTKLDIGVLPYERLVSQIGPEILERYGLKRFDIFSKNSLIFVSRDVHGRPMRLFARLPEGEPKFASTTTTHLLHDPWRGRGHLYLAHLIDRHLGETIIVEGQTDAVTLWQAGYKNIVAPCGCKNFGEEHADTLILLGIIRATALYDGDFSGQEGILSLLSKPFVKNNSLSVSVSVLPEGYDPDLYFREEGRDQLDFLLEQQLTAFEYLLTKEDTTKAPDEICLSLVPYIAGTSNEIVREQMARTLSTFVNEQISVSAILTEARRLDERVISEIAEKQKAIVRVTNRLASEDVLGARGAYRDAIEKMEAVEKESSPDSSMRKRCLSRIVSWYQADGGKSIGGYNLGPEFANLDSLLTGGSYKSGTLIVIGAIQNMGKSSFLDALIWSIVSREENNAIAYLLTIDDPAEARFRRMAAGSLRNKNFTQNMMSNPHFYADTYNFDDVFHYRQNAYNNLIHLVNDGKLFIEDSLSGRTVAYLETRVQQIRRENPTANLVVGLDNLHDTQDWPTLDKTERGSRVAKDLKRIAEMYRALVICTAEYRKGDPSKRGGDEDLADTRALKYAPRLTLHLFSDYVAKGEDSALLVREESFEWGDYKTKKLVPYICVDTGKNKICDEKKQLWFDFYPASSFLIPLTREDVKERQKKRRNELYGFEEPESENDEE